MNNVNPSDDEYVTQLLRSRHCVLALPEIRSEVSGLSIVVPDLKSLQDLSELEGALPSRARGDAREKTLYNIVQDLAQNTPAQRLQEQTLWTEMTGFMNPSSRPDVMAPVIAAHYRISPEQRSGSGGSPFTTPFHSLIPTAYDYSGRYKSFRGSLLLFLCRDGDHFDITLAEKLASFIASDDGLNLLDSELLRLAEAVSVNHGKTVPAASVENLLLKYESEVAGRFERGVFDNAGLRRIREDLLHILQLRRPRHDIVASLIQGLSLGLALYYYRLAFNLGTGLRAVVETCAKGVPPERLSFTGRLRFRVGSGGDKPVSRTDPCAQAFDQLDAGHLLALPAYMATLSIFDEISTRLGLTSTNDSPDPFQISERLAHSPAQRELFDATCAYYALRLVEGDRETRRITTIATNAGAGAFALREAVLGAMRQKGSSLKQRGRDVVHTLVGGYVGGLKRSRGNVNFFELDEGVLELFVQLILLRDGGERINFRQAFLPALAEYGLAPQHPEEEVELSLALERLGLLQRFSDSGEALYVSI